MQTADPVANDEEPTVQDATATSPVRDSPAPFSVRPRTAVIAIAVPVVVYLVTHALLLSRFPWFVDETIFAEFARNVEGDRNQRFAALVDHKGLINTWLGAIMIKLGASPMEAMRLLSMASGVVAATATGLLVKSWRGPRDGYFAFVLALFVPYLFVHGAVGVHDEFIAAGSMVALALQLSLARRPQLDRTLLLGFTFGLLLLSKPTGALAIALVPFSLLVFDWRGERRVLRLATWAGSIGLSLGIAGAMFLLSRLSPLAYTPAPDNHRTVSDVLTDPFANFGIIIGDLTSGVVGYMTLPVLLVALWGARRAEVERDRVGLVLIIWSLAALAMFLVFTGTAYPRYGLQVAAPLCALAVYGGVDLWARLARRRSPRIAWGVTGLALLPLVVLDLWVVIVPENAPYPGLDRQQYVTLISNRQPSREAAQMIVDRSPDVFPPDTPARDRTVALVNGYMHSSLLVLNGDKFAATPKFFWVDGQGDKGPVNDARWLILDGEPTYGLDMEGAKLIHEWKRPVGGPFSGWTTRLYDRGLDRDRKLAEAEAAKSEKDAKSDGDGKSGSGDEAESSR